MTQNTNIKRLHIAHGWGGGVEKWISDFSHNDPETNYILRSNGGREAFGSEFKLLRGDLPKTTLKHWHLNPAIVVADVSNQAYRLMLEEILSQIGPDEIIISSLIGHTLDVLDLDLPITIVLHDFFPYCLGINKYFGQVCTECASTRLELCVQANLIHPFQNKVSVDAWLLLREAYFRKLGSKNVSLVAPDISVKETLIAIDNRFEAYSWQIIPHGYNSGKLKLIVSAHSNVKNTSREQSDSVLKVLVLGNLSEHKGKELLLRLVEFDLHGIELYLLGCGRPGLEFSGLTCIKKIIPDYDVNDLADILQDIKPDCGLLLSLWEETYSYTLSELFLSGIIPLATNLGAFQTRIKHDVTGILFKPEPLAIASQLERVRDNKSLLQQLRANINEYVSISSLTVMRESYDDIFHMKNIRGQSSSRKNACILDDAIDHIKCLSSQIDDLISKDNESIKQHQEQASEIFQLHQNIENYKLSHANLSRQLSALKFELEKAYADKKRLSDDLNTVLGSRSWRYSKLLRISNKYLKILKEYIVYYKPKIYKAIKNPRIIIYRLKLAFMTSSLSQSVSQIGGDTKLQKSITQHGNTSWSFIPSDDYIEYNSQLAIDSRIKLIAFYLPQYHPIHENDEWWGKGFTEWTNVSRAVPQFEGHYQPRLPGELGFYDLRISEIHRKQINLAKQYGVYGFCYYYYWFSGKTLLELPLKRHLTDKTMDMPFCLCWANENWTRRWDGKESEILIGQQYLETDAETIIKDLIPYFSDQRYIKINNRPVFLIYRVDQIPDLPRKINLWNTVLEENDLAPAFVIAVQSFDIKNPLPYGCDAAVEFPPHGFNPQPPSRLPPVINPEFSGHIFDYQTMLPEHYTWPEYPVFRTVMPSWDNDARRAGKGSTFVNFSPKLYQEWLSKAIIETDVHYHSNPEMKFVFVNAWNEWAEGAYLEPDRKYGYAYLDATARSLSRVSSLTSDIIRASQDAIKKRNPIAVILHLYYDDLWEEIASFLDNLECFDIYVSLRDDAPFNVVDSITRKYPNSCLYQLSNRGRDIGPFLDILTRIKHLNYDYICKIHSKKSKHRVDGSAWRNDMFSKLLGSKKQIQDILQLFERKSQIGLLGPSDHLVSGSTYWGSNEVRVRSLAEKLDIQVDPDNFYFFAGSAFWFRPESLSLLDELNIQLNDFEDESGQVDGTLAHALERLFSLLVIKSGYLLADTDGTIIDNPVQASSRYQYAPNE